MLRNTKASYGLVAKFFHWVLFVMIAGSVTGGLIESAMEEGPARDQLMMYHTGFGALILLLALARLGWRLFDTTPAPAPGSALQQQAAAWGHRLLYVLMIGQPLSGVLMSQAAGYPVSVFGWFQLPTLVEKSEAIGGMAHTAHGIIWILLVAVVLGHAAMALHHHFGKGDNTLRRMGFGLKD
jgi:cytochrome b561